MSEQDEDASYPQPLENAKDLLVWTSEKLEERYKSIAKVLGSEEMGDVFQAEVIAACGLTGQPKADEAYQTAFNCTEGVIYDTLHLLASIADLMCKEESVGKAEETGSEDERTGRYRAEIESDIDERDCFTSAEVLHAEILLDIRDLLEDIKRQTAPVSKERKT